MKDYLERFQNRMEFVAVIDSIVNRRNKNTEIESWFEPFEIDNILFSILVFIMECTLSEDRECTLSEISSFLKDIMPYYNKQLSLQQIETVTRYLIKDILRSNGKVHNYGVMNYEKGGLSEISVMLIEDYMIAEKEVGYKLTSQGYNFLFRTKEIDDELGFKMEEFRLKLLIQKKNYKKAVSQSRELIQMLRNKENQLILFEKRLRNNLKQVDSEEYISLLNDINQTLEQEYSTMQDIHKMIDLSKKRLNEEETSYGELSEKEVNAKKEVAMIENNVEIALKLQRDLIIQCRKTKEIYVEMLRDAIRYMHKKTYDFEKYILTPLENGGVNDMEKINRLLTPLMKIQLKKSLNVTELYSEQSIAESIHETNIHEEPNFTEDTEITKKEKQSTEYVRLIGELLHFASQNKRFTLKDFLNYLRKDGNFYEMLSDKNTYIVFLKLYEFGTLDISTWKKMRTKFQQRLQVNLTFLTASSKFSLSKMIFTK